MDALPMPEDTGLDFASEHEGRMHACGHDLHTAMLVGAARLLSARRTDFGGNVIFMFQPGEEGFHGAEHMLAEGLLELTDPPPSGGLAVHVTTRYASGTVSHRPGPCSASADKVSITLTGSGGHASAPHRSLDPIPVAAEVVLAVQTAVTRRINVFEPGVITFAAVNAGTTHNVIPESAELVGTVRALSSKTRDELHGILRRVATNVASAHLVEAEVEITPGYPVMINDEGFTSFVTNVATELLGEAQVTPMAEPIMGAEDWSYVLQRIPGMMTSLGACLPELEPGESPSNHSNRVVFHEEAMATGIALHSAVAMHHLNGS